MLTGKKKLLRLFFLKLVEACEQHKQQQQKSMEQLHTVLAEREAKIDQLQRQLADSTAQVGTMFFFFLNSKEVHAFTHNSSCYWQTDHQPAQRDYGIESGK